MNTHVKSFRFFAIAALIGLNAARVCAQAWPEIGAGFAPLQQSAIAWGDFDNDGDLDLVALGWGSKLVGEPTLTGLYCNEGGGAFTDSGAALAVLQNGAVAWGDYDRDGDLDLAISGQTDIVNFSRLTIIYRNDAGTLTNINAGLPGVNNGSLAWGDYDNDGDLDLVVAGWTGATRITRIYRNTAGAFADSNAGLIGVNYGQVAWADYDNDGDLDLAVCGWAGGATRVGKIYRNQAGAFTDIAADLPGTIYGALAWGDYDNDGDFDLLLSGRQGNAAFGQPLITSRVYANDNGSFSDAQLGLEGTDGRGNVQFCSNAWGDYDNDGFS